MTDEVKTWLNVTTILGNCERCHSDDVEAFNYSTLWFNNGTEVRCNSCGNTGETTACSSEEVVVEWELYEGDKV